MICYTENYWQDVDKVLQQVKNFNYLSNKKVLITGCTGLIGSSIVDLLNRFNKKNNKCIDLYLAGRSYERVKYRFRYLKEQEDYIFVPYDATKNFVFTSKLDYIIHCASPADPMLYKKYPVETVLANVNGIKDLLEIAKKQKDRCRVLYVSSSEVYGQKKDRLPYLEDEYGYIDILNPRSSYPSSKRLSETLCIAYAKEYGVESVIARPGHIYGPAITNSDSRASAQFTRKAANKEPLIMKSQGNQLRSYCYSLDCASAILTILLNGKSETAYNISNKQSIVSIRDLAETFCKIANIPLVFENPTDEEKCSYNLMNNSALNAKKLEGLGWQGCFNIIDGVQATLKYYFYK